MEQILFIYDEEGTIITWKSGSPAPTEPVGVPFKWVDVPEGKRVVGFNTSVTPHEVILEDIPPTEIEQLKQTVADLTEIVLLGGM